MEYVTGVSKKETVEISEILSGDFEGKQVKVNGAVHTIRDMGEVAFVILRKREGLLQCVFEEGKTKFDLKELKEASTIEVEGTVRAEHLSLIHISEPTRQAEISYAVFCLKKKKQHKNKKKNNKNIKKQK